MFRSHSNAIRETVRTRWRQMITVELTDSRITDYAKPLCDMLSWYDPALFTGTENRSIQQWIVRSRDFLMTQSFGPSALHPTSNWQFYRLWTLSVMGVILKQPANIQFLRQEFRKALATSISPVDGSLEDFRERDSVEYHVYCLYAIIRTIRALSPAYRSTDGTRIWGEVDLWPDVKPAIDFMMRYAGGEATHIEFVDSRLATDQQRTDYGKPFIPSKCDYVLRELWDAGYTIA